MEPATTAALVASIVTLAGKASEKAAEELGKDAWELAKKTFAKIKSIMFFDAEPDSPDLKEQVTKALEARPQVEPEVRKELEGYERQSGQLVVVSVHVNKGAVNIAGKIDKVEQTFNFGEGD